MPPLPNVRVGIAALLPHPSHPSQLLLGQRLSSHGHGTLQFPGGHLEHGEEILACAARETLEETGLEVQALRLVAVVNSVFKKDGKHYVTLFVLCGVRDGSGGGEVVPRRMEPEKCGGWEWVEWERVCEWVRLEREREAGEEGRELFLPIVELVEGRGHLMGFPFEIPGMGGQGRV